jgi:hypothetical protein
MEQDKPNMIKVLADVTKIKGDFEKMKTDCQQGLGLGPVKDIPACIQDWTAIAHDATDIIGQITHKNVDF